MSGSIMVAGKQKKTGCLETCYVDKEIIINPPRAAPTLWIHHDVSVCHVSHPAFLLLAEQPPDGRLDALLLGLLVEGVLAAAHAAQGAGLRLQGGHDPEDEQHTACWRGHFSKGHNVLIDDENRRFSAL